MAMQSRITRREYILLMSRLFAAFMVFREKAMAQSQMNPARKPDKVGFLFVRQSSDIYSIDDIRQGRMIAICGGSKGEEFLREYKDISNFRYLKVPLSDLYTAFQTGVCDAIFLVSDGSYSPEEFVRRVLPDFEFRIIKLNP